MIRVERKDRVAHITFDRPDRGNALDSEGVRELRRALAAVDDAVGLVVFQGAGRRAFCGGADSRELVSLTANERREALASFYDAGLDIWEHPALTVAALDGYAVGGGAHIAMACDLRTIAASAWLQFPSSRYGLNLTAVWLTLLTGPATATALLASARRVTAEEALRLGLVQAIAPADEAVEVLGLVGESGLRELKAAVRSALPPDVSSALRLERERAIDLVAHDRFVASLSSEASVRGASS